MITPSQVTSNPCLGVDIKLMLQIEGQRQVRLCPLYI